MSLVIQSVRPNYFSKELLKFIFYETRFHKIYMNNLKGLNRPLEEQDVVIFKVTVIYYGFVFYKYFHEGVKSLIKS